MHSQSKKVQLAIVLVAVASFYLSCRSPAPPDVGAPGDGTPGETSGDGNLNIQMSIGVEPSEAPPPAVLPKFQNTADARGIDFAFDADTQPNRYLLPEIMGGGVAWIDYDLDGWRDLFLPDGGPLIPEPESAHPPNRLFRNFEGQFEDVAPLAAADRSTAYGQGCAVGDYNADGFPDLYIANYGRNQLLLNNGDGTFEDVSQSSQTDDPLWGSSCAWVDVNDDGLLDLYAANYLNVTKDNLPQGENIYPGPGRFDAQPDRVYVNDGEGAFVDRAKELGLTGEFGKGLAVIAMDFDDDGRVEIYVANDMSANFFFTRTPPDASIQSSTPTTPWRNCARIAGCAVSEDGSFEASMGIACADFDGDGRPDIFLTHFINAKSTLYKNGGDLMFEDNSSESSIAAISKKTLGFGTVAFDYDRDGAAELFVTNGHVLGPNSSPNEMPPQLFDNDGKGSFRDVSKYAAADGGYFAGQYLGRGAAGGDFDNDGDWDLGVTHVVAPFALLENQTASGSHWIGFQLQTRDRSPTDGAVVIISNGEKTARLQAASGGSYLSAQDSRVLMTVPGDQDKTTPKAKTVSVTVRWPGGEEESFGVLGIGRYWHIIQGEPPCPATP